MYWCWIWCNLANGTNGKISAGSKEKLNGVVNAFRHFTTPSPDYSFIPGLLGGRGQRLITGLIIDIEN